VWWIKRTDGGYINVRRDGYAVIGYETFSLGYSTRSSAPSNFRELFFFRGQSGFRILGFDGELESALQCFGGGVHISSRLECRTFTIGAPQL
jgi:hypothetical protein